MKKVWIGIVMGLLLLAGCGKQIVIRTDEVVIKVDPNGVMDFGFNIDGLNVGPDRIEYIAGAAPGMDTKLKTDDYSWETIGETTTAYTSPDETERDYDTFVENHADAIVKTFSPYRYNTVGFRFIVDDDGDDTVFDVFLSKGQDYFTRAVTLTIKGGTQVGPATSTATTNGYFADTITASNKYWIESIVVVDGGAGDRIATVWLDLCGFNTVAFVGTTVDDTTLVQATGY